MEVALGFLLEVGIAAGSYGGEDRLAGGEVIHRHIIVGDRWRAELTQAGRRLAIDIIRLEIQLVGRPPVEPCRPVLERTEVRIMIQAAAEVGSHLTDGAREIPAGDRHRQVDAAVEVAARELGLDAGVSTIGAVDPVPVEPGIERDRHVARRQVDRIAHCGELAGGAVGLAFGRVVARVGEPGDRRIEREGSRGRLVDQGLQIGIGAGENPPVELGGVLGVAGVERAGELPLPGMGVERRAERERVGPRARRQREVGAKRAKDGWRPGGPDQVHRVETCQREAVAAFGGTVEAERSARAAQRLGPVAGQLVIGALGHQGAIIGRIGVARIRRLDSLNHATVGFGQRRGVGEL